MPCSVLVVDDEEATRSALCEILELAGHTVRGVANGREALQEVERHCPEQIGTLFRRGFEASVVVAFLACKR